SVLISQMLGAQCWRDQMDLPSSDFSSYWDSGITYLWTILQLNFVLFLNTVRVLATKIWETNAVGYDTRKQYRIIASATFMSRTLVELNRVLITFLNFCSRKLAKSTLVLVFVFGVHYIVFVCLPHTFTGLGWEIRMHCELFFNSFQVQSEIKKTWARWNLEMDWGKTAPCGSYRYGSVLTNVTHSTSSQSQMVASSRVALISSRACKNITRHSHSHVNLPGYVRSNSEQDCIHHWVHEEADEDEEKKLDGISLKESFRLQDSHASPPKEKESNGEAEEGL
ncbi:hypothetical protein lerEdw1_014824, partial [Lerista edwardsae]